MLLKLLVLVLLGLVVFGGGRRVLGLASSLKRLPRELKEGEARAEDPVPFAKPVRGEVRDPQRRADP